MPTYGPPGLAIGFSFSATGLNCDQRIANFLGILLKADQVLP